MRELETASNRFRDSGAAGRHDDRAADRYGDRYWLSAIAETTCPMEIGIAAHRVSGPACAGATICADRGLSHAVAWLHAGAAQEIRVVPVAADGGQPPTATRTHRACPHRDDAHTGRGDPSQANGWRQGAPDGPASADHGRAVPGHTTAPNGAVGSFTAEAAAGREHSATTGSVWADGKKGRVPPNGLVCLVATGGPVVSGVMTALRRNLSLA